MGTLAIGPNSAYKKYMKMGGQLPFKDFLHQWQDKTFASNGEDKGVFLVNRQANDTVQTAIKTMLQEGGLKEKESGKTVFGVPKAIVIGGGIAIAGLLIFVIVKSVSK